MRVFISRKAAKIAKKKMNHETHEIHERNSGENSNWRSFGMMLAGVIACFTAAFTTYGAHSSMPIIARSTEIPAPSSQTVTSKTPVPAVWPALASFSPGQYVAFSDSSLGSNLYIIPLSGGSQQRLLNTNDVYPVTADGRKVILYEKKNGECYYSILDFGRGVLTKLPFSQPRCEFPSVSPDLQKLVMSSNGEIKYVDSTNNTPLSITHRTKEEEYYDFPLWSYDGKWIAYFNRSAPFEKDPGDGLYLFAAECLAKQSTCAKMNRGPFNRDGLFTHGVYTWSPDSRKIVIYSLKENSPLVILDVSTGAFSDVLKKPGVSIDNLAWSPDGEWIAYTGDEHSCDQSEDIFLVSVKKGTTVRLVDSQTQAWLQFWLTVPWPFHAGDLYRITPEGANLNLRKLPGLDAAITRRMMENETIQILEGPLDVDGYHWWRIKALSNGMEGWAADIPDWYVPVE